MAKKMTIANLDIKEPVPGFKGQFIHTDNLTVAHWRIAEGSVLPTHTHVNEQVANLIEGEFEMTVAGEVILLKAGDALHIAGSVPHGAVAKKACYLIEVFYPVREDYR